MSEELKLATAEERAESAQLAIEDDALVDAILDQLECSSRVKRQRAAATIALIAAQSPQSLGNAMSGIVAGLEQSEGQTRWECLNALCNMVKADIMPSQDALAAAEDALFDEDSGVVREAAFRFFCVYGATSPAASDVVWSNLNEAIQCLHGNGEFNDMLTSLVAFAEGDISKDTAAALSARMKFDAENAHGTLRMRSEQIVAACAAK